MYAKLPPGFVRSVQREYPDVIFSFTRAGLAKPLENGTGCVWAVPAQTDGHEAVAFISWVTGHGLVTEFSRPLTSPVQVVDVYGPDHIDTATLVDLVTDVLKGLRIDADITPGTRVVNRLAYSFATVSVYGESSETLAGFMSRMWDLDLSVKVST